MMQERAESRPENRRFAMSGISLANKCQLLFGFAVVMILTATLSVAWFRVEVVIDDYQMESSRQVAEAWMRDRLGMGRILLRGADRVPDLRDYISDADELPLLELRLLNMAELADEPAESLGFIADAREFFENNPDETEFAEAVDVDGHAFYRYARALRVNDMNRLRAPGLSRFSTDHPPTELGNALEAILLVDRASDFAESQLLVVRVFIIAAGLIGSLLAILVFYFILTKLILSPVRRLRRTTEKVEAGALSVRSNINTGDEFEQLSNAFNAMLDRVESSQNQLRAINEGLDLKMAELAEANVGLYESNRFKSEFLANVSHELRTPLNSIIGFAELLEEMAKEDPEVEPRRMRYLENILNSGRNLLEMINELLDMAKIEAGRMEVNITSMRVADLVEGLIGIMGPQAKAKSIKLETRISQKLPTLETDAGKVQQILYNFLSNAIKFTPSEGRIVISAERVKRQDNTSGIRIGVADSGPGIPDDMQDLIFEKFKQIDGAHTREHAGTGLGLAICRELAELLGANVSFVSEQDNGATFFLELPLVHEPARPRALIDDEILGSRG